MFQLLGDCCRELRSRIPRVGGAFGCRSSDFD